MEMQGEKITGSWCRGHWCSSFPGLSSIRLSFPARQQQSIDFPRISIFSSHTPAHCAPTWRASAPKIVETMPVGLLQDKVGTGKGPHAYSLMAPVTDTGAPKGMPHNYVEEHPSIMGQLLGAPWYCAGTTWHYQHHHFTIAIGTSRFAQKSISVASPESAPTTSPGSRNLTAPGMCSRLHPTQCGRSHSASGAFSNPEKQGT